MEEISNTENPEIDARQEKTKKPRVKKQSSLSTETFEEKENENAAAEAPAFESGADTQSADGTELGKFKSVEALMRAYRALEAEFTRRSQKLKALEESVPLGGNAEEKRIPREEELYQEVMLNEGVRARVLSEHIASLKGVPLMTGGGTGVKTPADRPKSIREAGSLALGYLRSQKN